MEKYSGIHDEKLTRVVSTFCIIAHCNWWSPTDNIQVFEYLNKRTEIFKHLNGSAFKYSDNSIGHSNI
jgi:hypothetical protein